MIRRTFDKEKINSVLKHPDIWPRISEKYQDIEEFEPPINESYHYLYDDGILFILHPEGDSLRIHANVTKEKREFSVFAANEALRYGFELGVAQIVAKIPVKYSTVYGFALKMGMTDNGVIGGDHHLSIGVEDGVC